jgi:hypothetical protein
MPREQKIRQQKAKKAKANPLTAVKVAKSAARARLGSPPPTLRHQSARERPQPKHKPTLSDLLAESE